MSPRTNSTRRSSGVPPLGRWVLLTLALIWASAALACGGGGGTTPNPPPPMGSLGGTVAVNGVPVLPAGDGSRLSVRVIDPQDIIASLPAPVTVGADGTFSIEAIPARVDTYYLQLLFQTGINLGTGGAGSTPVALNIPVSVRANQMTEVSATVGQGTEGGVGVGLNLQTNYQGPEGARALTALVNFRDNTVSGDLNGDGSLDDGISPDRDNDSIGEDKNGFFSNPGAFTEIEREGLVTALSNDSITVGGIQFRVTTTTNLWIQQTGAAILFSQINIGDEVRAKGFMNPTTQDVFATDVRLDLTPEDDDPVNPIGGQRELEREGLLIARTATTLRVADITFQVNAQTIIQIKDTKEPTTLDAIPIGACVDVKANVVGGNIIATRIRYDTTCDDGGGGEGIVFEQEGLVQAISPTSIQVNNVTFIVEQPVTVYDKDTEAAIPYAEVVVGSFVRVKATPIPAGLKAFDIRVDRDGDDGGGGGGGTQIEREGLVQAVTASSITVLNTTFVVNAATEIVIKDTDEPILLSEIQVGEECDVRGILVGDTLTANRIRVDRDDD